MTIIIVERRTRKERKSKDQEELEELLDDINKDNNHHIINVQEDRTYCGAEKGTTCDYVPISEIGDYIEKWKCPKCGMKVCPYCILLWRLAKGDR